jgi:hypothetical protein
LDGTGQNESFLYQVRVIRRSQSFYRDYVSPLQVYNLLDAGKSCFSVYDYGTSSTLTFAVT